MSTSTGSGRNAPCTSSYNPSEPLHTTNGRRAASKASATYTPTGPSSALTLGVKDLYTSGIYSDLTILCGGREFAVHKAVLHPQSSFFRTLMSGKFKEAAEDQSNFTLDDDPEVMSTLIHFFYNFTYDESARVSEAEAPFAVKVYAIADKYDVPPLRSMAALKLSNSSDPSKDVDEFIAAVCAIDEYTNPKDSTLWDIVVPKMVANIGWLADEEKFFALIHDMPVLNKRLLKHGKELQSAAPPSTDNGEPCVQFGGRRLG